MTRRGCGWIPGSWTRWRRRSTPKKGDGEEQKPRNDDGDEREGTGRDDTGRQRRRRLIRLRTALLGRSLGGLTTKPHLASGRRCRPLSFVLTAGQAADSPQFKKVIAHIKIRGRMGRPRTRPDAIAGDKACSSRGNRAYLRKRRTKAVIPIKKDQDANRRRKLPRRTPPPRSPHLDPQPPTHLKIQTRHRP
ncbi:transposase [Actinocorallia longicatena]